MLAVTTTNVIRITLIALGGLNLAVLVVLAVALRRLREQFRLHHRIISPVSTMVGLVRSLEAGLEQGGYTPAQRAAIYAAFEEQLVVFQEAVGLAVESPKLKLADSA
jgi:hypothetical protein